MTKCPRCSAEVPASQRFCGSCGSAIIFSSETGTLALPGGAAHLTPAHSPEEARFATGTVLAQRYRIMGRLGKGGMGEVHKAFDLILGQNVALKFLPEGFAATHATLERFRSEVRLARQVSHPNVCRVHDIGETGGVPFLSMEFVDGEDLASLLRRIGRLPADKALDIALRLCAGLQAAHDRGVLHRDLKPGNIMIDGRGEVLITDFGLAAALGTAQTLDARQGTPAYQAPEQLAGREVTAKSDIYALGLVLYEMFTGRRAYEAESREELLRMQQETTPPNLTGIAKEVDPATERAILRCLAPDPRQRPSSAKSVALALPGGDPLAAAMAAGETPSPEMVAAAGPTQGLRPGVAVVLFLTAIAGLVANAAIQGQFSLAVKTPFDNSCEALATMARDHVRRLGYPEKPADSASKLDLTAYMDYARTHYPAATRRAHLRSGRPAPLIFWYRQSPRPLDPGPSLDVQWSQPGFEVSGMIRLRLDMVGRLLAFEAMPRESEKGTAALPPDWNLLFTAAGLEMSRFAPVEPEWTPLMAFDTRAAWMGTWPETAEVPIRIEAASWHSKPVSFRIIQPWTTAARDQSQLGSPLGQELIAVLLAFVLPAAACLMARRNVKMNRGDRQGATRLAFFLMAATIVSRLLDRSYVAGPDEVERLFVDMGWALLNGAMAWVIYMSLEPHVRRRWPQSLITWTRLLEGRFRDPLLGAHVLIGIVIAVGLGLVEWAAGFATMGPELGPTGQAVPGLRGVRYLAGYVLEFGTDLTSALALVFLIYLLRTILRRSWLAGVVFVGIMAGAIMYPSYPPVFTAGLAIIYGMFFVTQLRWGLVAFSVVCVTGQTLSQLTPFTLDPERWYFGYSLAVMLVVAALAFCAFRISLGGRPLLKDETLG